MHINLKLWQSRVDEAGDTSQRHRAIEDTDMVNGFEELQKLSREGMDRTMTYIDAWTKGVQAIAVEVSEGSKKAYEQNSAFVQDLMGARTLDRAVEVQTGYAKSAYEALVAQATKLNGMWVDMTKDAVKPFEVAQKR